LNSERERTIVAPLHFSRPDHAVASEQAHLYRIVLDPAGVNQAARSRVPCEEGVAWRQGTTDHLPDQGRCLVMELAHVVRRLCPWGRCEKNYQRE
jgi:hypothetical protein